MVDYVLTIMSGLSSNLFGWCNVLLEFPEVESSF